MEYGIRHGSIELVPPSADDEAYVAGLCELPDSALAGLLRTQAQRIGCVRFLPPQYGGSWELTLIIPNPEDVEHFVFAFDAACFHLFDRLGVNVVSLWLRREQLPLLRRIGLEASERVRQQGEDREFEVPIPAQVWHARLEEIPGFEEAGVSRREMRPGETRNRALEAAIAENPDDPAGYHVYADWLLERQSIHGEWLPVLLEGSGKEVLQIRAALEKQDRRVRIARSPFVAGLQVEILDMPLGSPGQNLLPDFWDSPLWLLVRELVLKTERSAQIFSAMRRGEGRLLKRVALHGGDLRESASCRALFRFAPNLEHLSLHRGHASLAGCRHAALRELVLYSGSFDTTHLHGLLSFEAPKLESLSIGAEVFFAQAGEDVDGVVRALLDQEWPRLHTIGFRINAPYLVQLLLDSPLAAQIEVLEIGGVFPPGNAQMFHDHEVRLPRLREVRVRGTRREDERALRDYGLPIIR